MHLKRQGGRRDSEDVFIINTNNDGYPYILKGVSIILKDKRGTGKSKSVPFYMHVRLILAHFVVILTNAMLGFGAL